jgi:hypothetical protein
VVDCFLGTGVVVVVSFFITGDGESFLATGVVGGSFLTVGVSGGVFCVGIDSVLIVTGVDEGRPFIAAAFLAYKSEKYVYKTIYLLLFFFW